MYVHLGEDILVRTKDIVAILDKETVKSSQSMKELLESESNKIVPLTKGDFKSIVITVDAVYYSPLASGTLKKRSAKLAIQEF